MTDIVFRIVGDAGNSEQMFSRVDKSLQGLQQRQGSAAAGFAAYNKQSALTRQEMLALNYTVSDVAASLASGASPWTILLQQGGQVKDTFGGIGPLFSKLSTIFTASRLAVGGVATVFGATAVAAYQGWKESNQLATALFLTNNAAGMTVARFDEAARAVANFANRPIGQAREALMALASTGTFTSTSINEAAKAVVLLGKFTGESASTIVKDFEGMRGGVARWAVEHSRAYGYLTPQLLRHIQALEAQGKTQEAMKVNLDALNQKLGTATPRSLGYLEKAWDAVGRAASATWDFMMGLGRSETVAGQIEKMRADLVKTEADIKAARGRNAGATEMDALEARLKRLQGWLAANQAAGRKTAEEQAADEESRQRDIEAMSRENQEAALSFEKSQASARERWAETNRAKVRVSVDRQYQELQISAVEYVNRINALDRQALTSKEAVISAELALERKRPVGSPAEATAQQARLLEIESKRAAVAQERLQLEERIRSGTNVRDLDRGEEPNTQQTQFLRYERQQQQALEQSFRERAERAQEFRRELLEVNRQLGIELIQDDKQRGEALIALDEQVIRKRLDLQAMSDEERRQAEGDLFRYRQLREAQLTEQLKPQWQRQLEFFNDTNRMMRDSFDQTMGSLNHSAEDAWVEMQATGKFSTKRLVAIINEELARIAWRKYLAQPVSDFFGTALNALGIGGGDVGITSGDTGLVDLGLGAGRAGGGAVRRGSLHPVNEKGPEILTVGDTDYLMTGARDGWVTPNDQAMRPLQSSPGPASASPSVTVTMPAINVINNTGTPAKATTQQRSDGGFDVLLEAVEATVADRVGNGQGPLYQSMRGRFGLRDSLNGG